MKEFCVTLFTTLELWKNSSSELHYRVHFSECTFRLYLWCIRGSIQGGLRWDVSGELSYVEIQLLRESPRQTANYIVNKLVRILTRKIEGIG